MESCSPSFLEDVTLLEAGASDEQLLAALALAGPILADSHMQGSLLAGVDLARYVRNHHLIAALSARTALRPGLVGALGQWMAGHGVLPDHLRFNVEMVLQEALVNAVIHGNCGLPGLSRFGGDHDAYVRAVMEQVEKPEFGRRPVVVTVRCARSATIFHVDDVGGGFLRDFRTRHDTASLSGRGFALMRHFATALRLTRGGRRTSAVFCHG